MLHAALDTMHMVGATPQPTTVPRVAAAPTYGAAACRCTTLAQPLEHCWDVVVISKSSLQSSTSPRSSPCSTSSAAAAATHCRPRAAAQAERDAVCAHLFVGQPSLRSTRTHTRTHDRRMGLCEQCGATQLLWTPRNLPIGQAPAAGPAAGQAWADWVEHGPPGFQLHYPHHRQPPSPMSQVLCQLGRRCRPPHCQSDALAAPRRPVLGA